jgi:hypothetical protein
VCRNGKDVPIRGRHTACACYFVFCRTTDFLVRRGLHRSPSCSVLDRNLKRVPDGSSTHRRTWKSVIHFAEGTRSVRFGLGIQIFRVSHFRLPESCAGPHVDKMVG